MCGALDSVSLSLVLLVIVAVLPLFGMVVSVVHLVVLRHEQLDIRAVREHSVTDIGWVFVEGN